jgi:hypothetical protein
MAYYPPWQRRRPPRREPEVRQPTLGEMALQELKANEPEAPFGGWAGETVVPRKPQPTLVTGPVRFPEPDWEQERLEREERERAAERAASEELPSPHPPAKRETP